jgi:hypothetical protein
MMFLKTKKKLGQLNKAFYDRADVMFKKDCLSPEQDQIDRVWTTFKIFISRVQG